MKTKITMLLAIFLLTVGMPVNAQENAVNANGTVKNSEPAQRKGWDGTVKGITAVYPPNKGFITSEEALGALTFIWSPKSNVSVTYELRVWQIMERQTIPQALKATPMLYKRVVDATQLTVENLITGPCKPPYMCNFIYEIKAMDANGNVNNSSEITAFSIKKGWDGTIKSRE